MAKQLKARQCPRCGSPQKAEIRPDTCRCDNCGPEYFLDTDHYHPRAIGAPRGAARPALAPVPPGRVHWVLILLALVQVGSLGQHLLKRRQPANQNSELVAPLMTGRTVRHSLGLSY